MVEINGRAVTVTDNVWNSELPPDDERVVLEFRTDEGAVAAWREELQLDPRADVLLSQAPYLGVSCRSPNTTRCDRVGLAVWLREPARAGLRRMFAGFLRPAGLHDGPLAIPGPRGRPWSGDPPVSAVVTIVVVGRDGSRAQARVDTPLFPGWG